MKNIVITGSTRGIGFGLAKYFLEHQHNVVINGTSDTSLSRALGEFEVYVTKGQVVGVVGDVTKVETHERLVEKAVDAFGHIDMWINNAGIEQKIVPFFEHSPEGVAKIMNVNIMGVVYGSQAAYNHMNGHKGGYIYNMEGLGSDGRTVAKQIFYGGSKRALRYISRGMALEAKDSLVKIGTISPGMVATDFLKSGIIDDTEESRRRLKFYNILADRVEDVAKFLCEKMLTNTKNDSRIFWLTTPKVMKRFLTSPFVKRDVFSDQ